MSTVRTPSDDELQKYFDGELSVRRAREVRLRVEQDRDAQKQLAALEKMRDGLRGGASDAADAADFSPLWGRVQAEIAQQSQAQPGGWWRPLLGWGALAASTAVAVLLALSLWRPAPPSNECVIESLDVGPTAVSTIFTIEDPEAPGDVGATTVIWIDEQNRQGAL